MAVDERPAYCELFNIARVSDSELKAACDDPCLPPAVLAMGLAAIAARARTGVCVLDNV